MYYTRHILSRGIDKLEHIHENQKLQTKSHKIKTIFYKFRRKCRGL